MSHPQDDTTSNEREQRFCIYGIMADTWFTSDFHLGHFNIIRYCNRPFADTREMNAAILERLNAVVKPDDVLYFLGDFCMGGPKAVAFYRDQIACKTIHFIDGNHDRTARKVPQIFTSWSSLAEIKVGNQGIVLCHYAMKVWPQHSRGTWQLYGHSHGNLPDDPLSLSMDVGVDSHDFRPWHFDEIQAVMKVKAEAKAKHIEMTQSMARKEES
jgi:calcineurin-like phosphoesterase family protein